MAFSDVMITEIKEGEVIPTKETYRHWLWAKFYVKKILGIQPAFPYIDYPNILFIQEKYTGVLQWGSYYPGC